MSPLLIANKYVKSTRGRAPLLKNFRKKMKPACKSCTKEHETTFGGANKCGFHSSIKKN
jgi:hypothetical protein